MPPALLLLLAPGGPLGAQQGASAPSAASAAAWPVGDYDDHARRVVDCLRSEIKHPVRLCVLFDVSGSMLGIAPGATVTKLAKARQAWATIVKAGVLRPGDTVRVTFFSNVLQDKLPETRVTESNLEALLAAAPAESDLARPGPGRAGTIIGYADHQAVTYALAGKARGQTPCVLLVSDGFDDEVPAGYAGRQQWLDYRSRPPSRGFLDWQAKVANLWHLVIPSPRHCCANSRATADRIW